MSEPKGTKLLWKWKKITQTGELLDLPNLLDMISLDKRSINRNGR